MTAFQIVWLLVPRFDSHPVSPRVRHTIETHLGSGQQDKDAAIAEAMSCDSAETRRKAIFALVGVVGVDLVLFYLFWNRGRGNQTSHQSLPPTALLGRG